MIVPITFATDGVTVGDGTHSGQRYEKSGLEGCLLTLSNGDRVSVLQDEECPEDWLHNTVNIFSATVH